MEMQDAVNNGYYFDRCIDLYFYDEDERLLGSLICPKRSFKPSITVKGTFIEGEYSISSYISVQNMSYDVDVNAVAYIDCHMYYGALTDSKTFNQATADTKGGRAIYFSVLYCDQEKEPPNRAVRFQCTVAAQDRTRFEYRMAVLPSGDILTGLEFDKLSSSQKNKGIGGKDKVINTKLINVLKKIADMHNKNVDEKKKKTNEKNPPSKKLNEKLKITSIVCDENCAKWDIALDPEQYTIGSLLRKLNCYETDKAGNKSYCRWKVSINSNTLNVTTIAPDNWRLIADAEGYKTQKAQSEYYNKYFRNNVYMVYTGESWNNSKEWAKGGSLVYLNYIKGAYRNETDIHCTTIYDDRIRPGCFCVIQANAIMGRHSGRGGKSGSRLINMTNQLVVFRVSGSVQYEFSTTEDSVMSMMGVIDNEATDKINKEKQNKQRKKEVSMTLQR